MSQGFSRGFQWFSMANKPWQACLEGSFSLKCPLYGQGERLVVGHMSSAFAAGAGTGKASNFAAGTADRFPAWGTSQIAVLPATTSYPAKTLGETPREPSITVSSPCFTAVERRNPCASKSPASIDTLSARLKATSRNLCGKNPSEGFDTRPAA